MPHSVLSNALELTEIKMDVIESLRDVLPLSQSLISDLVDTVSIPITLSIEWSRLELGHCSDCRYSCY